MRRRSACLLGLALCLCASVAAGAHGSPADDEPLGEMTPEDATSDGTGTEPTAEFHRCNKAAWRVPGHYLLVLRRGTHESHAQRTLRRLRARAVKRGHHLGVLHTYSGALRGFLLQMSEEVLQMALRLPHVDYIEEDSYIFAQSAPWNLQKLLQPYGATYGDGAYKLPNDRGKAEVYLMDGSVQASHRELEGRVLITDFNNVPEEDGVRVHRQASQCDSHGTHVAGVVSGSDSGVARGARISVVRVLNCQGKGTVSGALAGVEYIRATLQARPTDAVVVLLPFVGSFSPSLNAACRQMVSDGAVVVAAAGNYRDDACLYSPASEPEVITVGAVNLSDQLMSQGAGGTNFGRCVDVFAPGDDIVSASSDCSTCFTSRSGTSQAAAHAAGVAAMILSSDDSATPLQVLHTMLRYSTSNTINLLSLSEGQRVATPNLVLALPPAGAPSGELLCRSVWSERSGDAPADKATSHCRHGEVMMGCSSYSPDGARGGETITEDGAGEKQCLALSGPGGGAVYAVARCCVTGGLQCRVHGSPRPGQDAECENPRQHLSGCASHPRAGSPSDSRPHHGDRKRCGVTDGVTSHAVCCQGPSLDCRLLENISAGKSRVEVTCPSGWTLTDCSTITRGSAILGPVAKGNSCHVHSAIAADGAAGMAVCCRVRPPEQPPKTPL